MATRLRNTHFVLSLIASWIDVFKKAVAGGAAGGAVSGTSASTTPGAGGATAPAFTGTAPTTATALLLTGTGYSTAGQVVTTTATDFNASLDQYAGCWLLCATKAPCRIVSHPAAAGAALVFTVEGAAPATTAEGFNVYGAPTPAGTVASHTHTGAAHTHGAGTFAGSPASGAFHYDRGEYTVTAAASSSLETSRTLLIALLVAYDAHARDALAHDVLSEDDLLPDPLADIIYDLRGGLLSDLIEVANDFKDIYNAHLDRSGVHPTDDTTNAVVAADATDQTSLNTLLNAMKTAFNAHFANGFPAPSWRITPD